MKLSYHQYPFIGYPILNGLVWGTVAGIVLGAIVLLVGRSL